MLVAGNETGWLFLILPRAAFLFDVLVVLALGKFLVVYVFVQELIDLLNVHVALELAKLVDRNLQPIQVLMHTWLWCGSARFFRFLFLRHAIKLSNFWL